MATGVRGANPIWFEVDLTTHAFDDTFYLFVLENTIPYNYSDVYHDSGLTTVWDQPIQFLANGTLPTDIFFVSGRVYRLEFRQGPTQQDPLIYLVENYRPEGGSGPIDTVAFTSSNQITNPQFSLVNFSVPYSVSGTDLSLEVAPGWVLELGGSGTVELEQEPLDESTKNPSNAPYALHITLTGWDSGECFLRQRFEQNGMLWANKTVSSTLTARINGAPQDVNAFLIDSNDVPLATILEEQEISGAFEEYTGYGVLGDTTNPDMPPAAYIDYKLALPNNVDIYVTSIQVVVQDLPVEPSFEQDSINRQIDHAFNYYKDRLAYKPIPSYLVGWDFVLNPAQHGESFVPQAVGANKSYYTWDQTIIFQSEDSAITVTREATIGMLELIAAPGKNTKMAVIQYLTSEEAQNVFTQLVSGEISVNVEMSSTVEQTLTISLWWSDNASLPNVDSGTNDSVVSALDDNGFPSSVASGWYEVGRKNLGKATFSSTNATSVASFGFSNFRDESAYLTGKYFAIVVGTNTVLAGNAVEFRSISLVPGQIPTIPAPQTQDEVLRECQRYYETTFLKGATVPSAVTGGQLIALMVSAQTSGTLAAAFANTFGGHWETPKWSTPSLIFYSGTSTTANRVQSFGRGSGVAQTAENDISSSADPKYWDDPVVDSKGFRVLSRGNGTGPPTTQYLVNNIANIQSNIIPATWIQYHYVSDCRPGIILS